MNKIVLACLGALFVHAQDLSGAGFLAQATDKTGRDARSNIHYGDSIEHHGVVTYLIVNGKRLRFTRDNIRGFAEGRTRHRKAEINLTLDNPFYRGFKLRHASYPTKSHWQSCRV